MSEWTNEDLVAINAAIKSGTTRVRYADREVTYRSLDELVSIRNLIRGELGLTGDDAGRTHRYASFDKGLR